MGLTWTPRQTAAADGSGENPNVLALMGEREKAAEFVKECSEREGRSGGNRGIEKAQKGKQIFLISGSYQPPHTHTATQPA